MEQHLFNEETTKHFQQLIKAKFEEIVSSPKFMLEIKQLIAQDMKKIKKRVLKETEAQRQSIIDEVRRQQVNFLARVYGISFFSPYKAKSFTMTSRKK